MIPKRTTMLTKITDVASVSTIAVAARRDVARVDRQQQDRHQLRDDVGELVGAERADEALQVAGHER